jgi:hypothetical protein
LLAQLSFNYIWSNPSAGDDVLAAAAVARPIWKDFLILAKALGPKALECAWAANERDGWDSLGSRTLAKEYLSIIAESHQEAIDARRELAEEHIGAT